MYNKECTGLGRYRRLVITSFYLKEGIETVYCKDVDNSYDKTSIPYIQNKDCTAHLYRQLVITSFYHREGLERGQACMQKMFTAKM